MTTTVPFRSVSDLTAPLDFSDYVTRYWSKGFHHIPTNVDQTQRALALFNINDFLEILHKAEIRGPYWNLTIDGQNQQAIIDDYVRSKLEWSQPPSLTELEALCRDGASLVFNKIESYDPKLIDFCRQSVQTLGENVNMNAYFSPAKGKRGLGCHYDIQEHFIIQFSGSKRWRFYEGLVDNPIERVDFTQSSDERRPQDRPFTDVIVQPGDILYFARGQWHEPVPLDTHSLHLTVTIPSTFQFRAIKWLTKHLSQQEHLRRFLPQVTQSPSTQQAWRDSVEAVRREAIAILSSREFSRQAFFDKFQESFSITSDHKDDDT